MQEKELSHKGKKIFYRTIGSGPLVVLLHGVPFDGTLWSHQFDAFAGYQLVIPDLPGSGRSEMMDDMSMESMAEAVKEIIVHEMSSSPHLTSPNGGRTHTQTSLVEDSRQPNEDDADAEFYAEADPMTYSLLKQYALKHRRSPTEAEVVMWEQLRSNRLDGYSFRRQHIIGNFIVDFVCLAKKLVLEVDGLVHQLPDNKLSDQERTEWLGRKGYKVLRFTNEEVLFDLENTLGKINSKLNELPLAPRTSYNNVENRHHRNSEHTSLSGIGAADLPPLQEPKELPPASGASYNNLEYRPQQNSEDASLSGLGAADLPPLGELKGAIVIGHSMGGYVTLALADRYPQMLHGFGLFHSTAYADSDEKKQTRQRTIDAIREKGVEAFVQNSVANLFSPVTKKEHPEIIEDNIRRASTFSSDALIRYYEAMMQRPDRTSVLKNSTVPVLFILGKYDNAVPLKDGLEQCSLPDIAYIHILENAGHTGMREQPDESNTILSNYLKHCHHHAP